MKKRIKLLKNKHLVRSSLEVATFATIIIIPFFAIFLKLGISKWRVYDIPITWDEFFSKVPLLILLSAFVFCIVFALSLFSKNPNFVICVNCLNSYYEANTEDGICPNCSSKLEDLTGFYDRHPDLLSKSKGKT
jgi:ABC-type amino acid transport system permease subunit